MQFFIPWEKCFITPTLYTTNFLIQKIGEIIDVNPNSHQTIKLVLESICKQGGIGSTRKWIKIGFDGSIQNCF